MSEEDAVPGFDLLSQSPDESSAIAKQLAPHLRPGDVVLLVGGLAAGKTHFVKAVGDALGSQDNITSPTYTIAQFYQLDQIQLLHVDAYRLSGEFEFRDLGLEEYLPQAIAFVEWGEKIAGNFANYLMIEFSHSETGENIRQLNFSFHGPRWETAADGLKAKLAGEAV